MRYMTILLVIILIAFNAESYSRRKKLRTRSSSSRSPNRRTEWYRSRHQFQRYRYLMDTNQHNALKIRAGEDKGKPITVDNCGMSGIVHSRIVNGRDASFSEYPWVVSIQSTESDMLCAGSILNERWIISAAHCFRPVDKRPLSTRSLSIRVGTIYRNEGTEYRISRVVIHDLFNNDGMMNSDIALLKTSKPILMENSAHLYVINGVCLPTNKYAEPRANSLLVVGWGKLTEERDQYADKLQEVSIPIINDKQCSLTYRQPMDGYPKGVTIYASQICAFSNTRDACHGDSGGPAMEMVNGRVILVGIVSYGIGCATSFPGIYTQVSWFLDWISANMK